MLADNVLFLRKEHPAIYQMVRDWENQQHVIHFLIENTKVGNSTLKYTSDEQTVYLHSKYDPVREAELFISEFFEKEEVTETTRVIFYGLGLGYNIEVFIKKFPDTTFSIIEPSVEIFSAFLDRKLLKNITPKKLASIHVGENPIDISNMIMQSNESEFVICGHPVYKKMFSDEYNGFLENTKTSVVRSRESLQVNNAFKKRWIINSVKNFQEVLKTPNILMGNRANFEGKTAILVSAGPSLDFEIDNLRQIKEKKMACIISVGSAINTLLHHNLHPDAMCTYDPSEKNQVVFHKLIEMNVNSIPMIFGTSAVYETMRNYNGPKLHMITNQDTVSEYFLKSTNEEVIATVNDAPSIAVVTLELLHKLKFEEVILVGQNLALLEKKNYADGIEYQNSREEPKDRDLRIVKDVTGKDVFTIDSYILMNKTMESYIRKFCINVINTTTGGAEILGSSYIPMDDLVKNHFIEHSVSGDEFKDWKAVQIYDQEYLKMKYFILEKEFKNYISILSYINELLVKIDELIRNKNNSQVANMHKKTDALLRKLEENDFARIFAFPMHRVEHQLLVINVQRLRKEKDEQKMQKELVKYYSSFIGLLSNEYSNNQYIMDVLKNTILEN